MQPGAWHCRRYLACNIYKRLACAKGCRQKKFEFSCFGEASACCLRRAGTATLANWKEKAPAVRAGTPHPLSFHPRAVSPGFLIVSRHHGQGEAAERPHTAASTPDKTPETTQRGCETRFHVTQRRSESRPNETQASETSLSLEAAAFCRGGGERCPWAEQSARRLPGTAGEAGAAPLLYRGGREEPAGSGASSWVRPRGLLGVRTSLQDRSNEAGRSKTAAERPAGTERLSFRGRVACIS